MRIGEAQYEAAGDHDVHDDAHVHVPHEHASLRFQVNADRFPTGVPVPRRTKRKLHRRDELPLLFNLEDLRKVVKRMIRYTHRARLMAQCNRESRRM